MNVGSSVKERYSRGAAEREASLCCPVDYDSGLLAILPDEIVSRDYGCGDPSRYVQQGDVVLDLGAGGGKICYMAAQLVGNNGQVIGIYMNDDMLALARKYRNEMAARLGGDRVRFLKGYIQDLALDLEALDEYLEQHPVSKQQEYAELKAWETRQRNERPLIPNASVDLVISNCVLNLVSDHEKQQLVQEIFRVLKPGGRIAISDIVSDKTIPAEMKKNAELWSGCISGAFQEARFLQTFADNGFQAVCYDKWESEPWRVIDGIEFRSVTLTAVKDDLQDSGNDTHSVIYRGPFASVIDDSGNRYPRGERVPVTMGKYASLTGAAYMNAFIDPAPGTPETSSSCCSESQHTVEELQSGNDRGCC